MAKRLEAQATAPRHDAQHNGGLPARRVRPYATRKRDKNKVAKKFKILGSLAGVAIIGLVSLNFVPVGVDSAQGAASDTSSGPVVYLNHEGTISDCEIIVTATDDIGQAYHKGYNRPNCDGGMMLPALQLNSKLIVEADSEESDAGGELIVADRLDVSKLSSGGPGYVTNSTAICFLVYSDGSMAFTKASDEPNPRPCAWP
jgi:hypothetical protein